MTIGTDFNAWFEGEVEGLTLEERVDHLKMDMIFWRDTAMKEAEQYQSLAKACHESDLKLEARAKLWKSAAKAQYKSARDATEDYIDLTEELINWQNRCFKAEEELESKKITLEVLSLTYSTLCSRLKAKSKLWKKLAKNLYFDLLLAHEELDEADNMDAWFT